MCINGECGRVAKDYELSHNEGGRKVEGAIRDWCQSRWNKFKVLFKITMGDLVSVWGLQQEWIKVGGI